MNLPSRPFGGRNGRISLLLLIIVSILAAVFLLPQSNSLEAAVAWSRSNPAGGGLLFITAAVFAAVLFVPGSLIAMLAGYIYDFALGSAVAILAISAGAFAAFLSGRLLVREWASKQMQARPRLQALDQAVNQKAFVLVLLTRLSFVIPFNVLNYVYGATGVGRGAYFFGTSIGMIPPTIIWTYAGTLASDLQAIRSGDAEAALPGGYLLIIGMIALLLAVVVVQRAASRALRERLDAESDGLD